MKNNSQAERHRVLQRSSNITVGGRRQNIKCYDGVRYIAGTQQEAPIGKQQLRQKGAYHQCMDYLKREEEPSVQVHSPQEEVKQREPEAPLNDNTNRVVPQPKLIP